MNIKWFVWPDDTACMHTDQLAEWLRGRTLYDNREEALRKNPGKLIQWIELVGFGVDIDFTVGCASYKVIGGEFQPRESTREILEKLNKS